MNVATGAFGGARYGATNLVRGVPKLGAYRMRPMPRGPSVELPMRPQNAVLGVRDACGHTHWDLRWSSLWGHETCEGCSDMEVELHADPAPGAFGGAPYGATNRVRGVLKRVRRAHTSAATGTFGGAP